MQIKDAIITIWLTVVLTFIGFSKVLIIIPFVLQLKIGNNDFVKAVDLVFWPAIFANIPLERAALSYGPLLLLMASAMAAIRFILFALESFVLAVLILSLVDSKAVKEFFGNLFFWIGTKFGATDKVDSYVMLRNVRYFITITAIIILAFFGYFAVKKDIVKKQNINVEKKEISLLERAEKIDSNIDSDSDGLPDKAELVLGTDLNFADTDADGHNDYSELKNGYNPFIVSPSDKLDSETFNYAKEVLFGNNDNKNIEYGKIERLRYQLENQISDALCKSSSYAGGNLNDEEIAEQAVKASDPCLCSKMADDRRKNDCFLQLVSSTNNPALCNYILEGSADTDKIKAKCFYTLMFLSLNEKYCFRIKEGEGRTNCVVTLSLETKQYDLCGSIKNSGEKDKCYYSVAVFLKNAELCKKISQDAKEKSAEECQAMIKSLPLPKINL